VALAGIRIPAAFQGLYGLRPSYNRVPYGGSVNSMMGQEVLPSVLGPLSVSIDGLSIFMKAVMAGQPWRLDPLALRIPWSEEEYQLANHGGPSAKLVFAIQWDDGFVKPQAPYKRAMDETKAALLAAGHEVVDWVPYKAAEGNQILSSLYFADGLEDLTRHCALTGEPMLTPLAPKEPVSLSTYEYWQLTLRRNQYIKGHLDHWEATAATTGTGRPVDAIITAAGATTPHPHGDEP
jgi:amidase